MVSAPFENATLVALRHHEAGRLAQAEAIYREVLAQQPNHPEALHLMGVLAGQAGRLDVAIDHISRAIQVCPTQPYYHNNLAKFLKDAGQIDAAIAAARRAIALQPDLIGAHHNLGEALAANGQFVQAIACLRQVLAANPQDPEAHNSIGAAYAGNGQPSQAISHYRKAIEMLPNYAPAYCNLGDALREMGRFPEAIAACREAHFLHPSCAEALINLGNALRDNGQPDEAIAAYRHSLQLKPNRALTHNNLGGALKDVGDLDAALAAFRAALQADPTFAPAHSNLLCLLHFHPDFDAAAIAAEHRVFQQRHADPLRSAILPHTNNRDPDRRLRIGYVSPDFRDHAVGLFLLPLLAAHDHASVDVFCYSDTPAPDAITERLRAHADVWRSIAGQSHEQVAAIIRNDQIDILVDLTMHLANNRLLAFARKPAPVQVSYLAYCASTGLSAMDYRLTDSRLDPPDAPDFYCEKSIRLPNAYWCYAQTHPTPEVSSLPAQHNGQITLGCLNNFCKVSPNALSTWAALLARVPNSRLVIHAAPGKHRQRVTSFFAQHGIAPDRIAFTGKMNWGEYCHQYQQIDIALDPFPYGGGGTTCDALWMGVPVITLAGQTAVGRGGVSILSTIGLPELIARTPEQYIELAANLASDLPRLSALRATLRPRMAGSPLMNSRQFARDIESAYRQMWHNWCAS